MPGLILTVLPVLLLACGGSQDAAPTTTAPDEAAANEAETPPPDRTATESDDAAAVKEASGEATPLPSFEGDHAMARTDAVRASLEWLALVDAGDHDGSWDASASIFQDNVPKAGWGQQISGARDPLGLVTSRGFHRAEYTKTRPGAPDGEYVVIQFNTVFENKASAVETITPMMDWDGSWKVSGYFVK